MHKIKKLLPLGVALLPFVAFAQNINSVINTVMGILNAIVPLLIAIAVVVFLWGVITYVTAGGDEEKRKTAKSYMIYGIIGLFVMVAVWGLVNILGSTLGLNNAAPNVPVLPT